MWLSHLFLYASTSCTEVSIAAWAAILRCWFLVFRLVGHRQQVSLQHDLLRILCWHFLSLFWKLRCSLNRNEVGWRSKIKTREMQLLTRIFMRWSRSKREIGTDRFTGDNKRFHEFKRKSLCILWKWLYFLRVWSILPWRLSSTISNDTGARRTTYTVWMWCWNWCCSQLWGSKTAPAAEKEICGVAPEMAWRSALFFPSRSGTNFTTNIMVQSWCLLILLLLLISWQISPTSPATSISIPTGYLTKKYRSITDTKDHDEDISHYNCNTITVLRVMY